MVSNPVNASLCHKYNFVICVTPLINYRFASGRTSKARPETDYNNNNNNNNNNNKETA